MGRPPIGKVAMTSAERVRKHRLKQSEAHVTKPVTKPVTEHVTKPVTKQDETRIRQLETANADLKARLAERDREIEHLREQLKAKVAATPDETTEIWIRRAMQSEENNRLLRQRKGLLTQSQFNHLRACLHTDSRKQISDGKLTQTRWSVERSSSRRNCATPWPL
jgi:predicted RNase H-like nuclease (RuvC/YqgF family)